MEDLHTNPDLPVILVSASESNWYKFHEKIIKGFKNVRHIALTGGHYIRRYHPDLTVNFIKELVHVGTE